MANSIEAPSSHPELRGRVLSPVALKAHEDAEKAIAERKAGVRPVVVLPPVRANAPLSLPFDLKGLTLAPGVVKAYEDAEAAIAKMQEGAKASAKAEKAARMAMAEAKLKALKIAAIFTVHAKNSKAARAVAEEAAKTARELKGLRDTAPAEASNPSPGTPPPTVPAPGEDSEMNKDIDALIQQARKVIAIARKAARPGSTDEQAMAALQAKTGVPDISIDVVTEKDLKVNAERQDHEDRPGTKNS